jgi:hypothetical protein
MIWRPTRGSPRSAPQNPRTARTAASVPSGSRGERRLDRRPRLRRLRADQRGGARGAALQRDDNLARLADDPFAARQYGPTISESGLLKQTQRRLGRAEIAAGGRGIRGLHIAMRPDRLEQQPPRHVLVRRRPGGERDAAAGPQHPLRFDQRLLRSRNVMHAEIRHDPIE